MPDQDIATDSLRARLAAERSMTQKQRELTFANMKIAAHARTLSDEVIERRREAAAALSEARSLESRARTAMTEMRVAKSETQIAERRLWDSIETIDDGFAVFDADRRVVASNRAFFTPFADLEFVGLGTRYDELVQLMAEEGLVDTGDMGPMAWIRFMRARWDAPQIEPVTLRFFNNRFVRLSERRTRDGDIVMLAINITNQIRHQRVLEEARRKAEAASRAKSAFLANMSHEIRTPMNGVLAMADLLGEGPLSDEQKLCLDTIRQSGEALLVIINDVLDYSKIEAQKLALDMRPFDLEATVSEVVTLLQPTARGKGVDLVVDYDMFLPTGFTGDKGRLRQVLLNLLGNAVKFTAEGHVTVRVVGLPGDEPGVQTLHLTVEDTGIGIAPDKLEHIFGEFNQADDAATREFDGTGLGLAITRRLIGLMGGEVWVDSTPGEGSVFGIRLTLPLGDAEADEPLPEALRQVRAIVRDDMPARRAVLEKQVAAMGLDVVAAAADARPDPRDLVFAADAGGPGGTVRIGFGARGPAAPDAPVLHYPVLRRTLRAALATLGAPAASSTAAHVGSSAAAPAAATNMVLATPTPAALALFPAAVPDTTAAAAEVAPDPAPAAPAAPLLLAGHRQMRVLCAEDNKTNRLVLTSLLKGLDIDLTVVENGAEAVEAARASRPDLIFTDISMPVMDGREAARAIRAHEARAGLPRVPIIAMTAHASDEDRDLSLAAGIDLQLTKPLKKPLMVAQIDAAMPPDCRALHVEE